MGVTGFIRQSGIYFSPPLFKLHSNEKHAAVLLPGYPKGIPKVCGVDEATIPHSKKDVHTVKCNGGNKFQQEKSAHGSLQLRSLQLPALLVLNERVLTSLGAKSENFSQPGVHIR